MLEGFHDRFLDAVNGNVEALSPWCAGPRADAGLSVYRNTIAKGRADALAAQFPTVERVVGAAWLAAAANAHGAEHPPRTASLLSYGGDFADWLSQFPPAADMPFLSELARLDYLWSESHLAADAEPLQPDALAGMTPEAFGHHALTLHPATRFAGFGDSTPDLWRALQPPSEAPEALELGDAPQGLLITRPALETTTTVIGSGELAFLQACEAGHSLADAAVAAVTRQHDLDLSILFARQMTAGVFASLRTLA